MGTLWEIQKEPVHELQGRLVKHKNHSNYSVCTASFTKQGSTQVSQWIDELNVKNKVMICCWRLNKMINMGKPERKSCVWSSEMDNN